MTKIYCDFCGNESKKMLHAKLPTADCIEVSGGIENVPLIRFGNGITIADKDICYSCALRLMIAMGMIHNVDIEYKKEN